MLQSKYLTGNQRAVLADLFSGKFTVQEVLDKRKVTRRTYYKWHAQPFFAAEFKRLLELSRNEYQFIFAHYAPDVAMKLVSLTTADKDETARKACMDVIANHERKAKHKSENESKAIAEPPIDLSPEVASKMLALLADEKKTAAGKSNPPINSGAKFPDSCLRGNDKLQLDPLLQNQSSDFSGAGGGMRKEVIGEGEHAGSPVQGR